MQLGLGQNLVSGAALVGGVPSTAILFNGVAVTFGGSYLTFTP